MRRARQHTGPAGTASTAIARVAAILLLSAATVLLVPLVAGAAPAGTGRAADATSVTGERITHYGVDVTIPSSGEIVVTEQIAYDFGATPHHGIFRDVPVRVYFDKRDDRRYRITVESVTATGGASAHYSTSSISGGKERIKIGDPNATITGAHTYTITYRVRGALNAFADHDELVWNAVGNDWTVPIDTITVTVHAPAAIPRVACSAGPLRSTLPCASATVDGSVAHFTGSTAEPGAGLTVTVALPLDAATVGPPILVERWSFNRAFARSAAALGVGGGLLALIAAGLGALLWRVGRDRRYVGSAVDLAFGNPGGKDERVGVGRKDPIPVEYTPPDGLRPGQMGTLVDERADPVDVTGTIIDLAVRGYLRIEEIPKSGWLGKPDWNLVRRKDDTGLAPWESVLMDALFVKGTEVKLSSLRNSFASSMARVQSALYDDAVARGWFTHRPDRTRNGWHAVAVAVIVVGGGLVWLAARYTHLGLVPIPLVLGGLILLVAARDMPRRTARGTASLTRALGFRRFIVESEKDRARFAEKANLFTEYLPYAVVFGVTEQWARTFAGLDAQTAAAAQSWYSSTQAFSLVGFAHGLDGFATASMGTLTSAARGSSGFSGGGSSGGGGGGGGGGSW